jgi:drug/metabolite transporter (DMT)-like permease
MYFSLQHLSLSDATVLTFMAPILTGFSGAVFLKEPLSIGEVLAGCKHLKPTLTVIVFHQMIVCSFLGVVLISRPQFLFGSSQGFLDLSEGLAEVTPTGRMMSIL